MKKIIFLLLFTSIIPKIAMAETLTPHKKFEWGIGFLSIYGNHYRGSDQSKSWFLPMPYFTYSSEHIEAEPSFIRGIFIRNEYFSFKLSLLLGLNVESKLNKAREDMPPLDYTIEAGPMMVFHLWHSQDKDLILNFEVPVRQSFATNLHYLRPVGIFSVPYLNLIHSPIPTEWNWNSEFSISPMFADQKFHQYFYGVNKEYVRPDRHFYKARGGYSGFQTALILNKRIKNFAVIPFFRWDYLDKAVFENSPLVKAKNYVIGGIGIFWLFN